MLKRKVKLSFILAIIVTLIAPYTTVFAALKSTDETAKLQSPSMHEGGPEASGTLTDDQKALYDTMPHEYHIGETLICKIVNAEDRDENGVNYSDAFYCLDAMKSFPGEKSGPGLEYKNVGDFYDATLSSIKTLDLTKTKAEDEAVWTANYKALKYLFKNLYLEKQAPMEKDAYLEKAFADTDYDLSVVKALLTDDDIDVVQQYAIWYFTNRDTDKFNVTTLPAVTLKEIDNSDYLSYNDLTGSPIRQDLANALYKYLITTAQNTEITEKEEQEGTYPTIENTSPKAVETGEYIAVGPFKVNSGSTSADVKILDQSGNEISKSAYKVLIAGETDFSSKTLNEILDKEYYIYLPKTNKDITKVNLELNYTTYESQATVWKNPTVNDVGIEVYQPLVLLTKEPTPHKTNLPVEIKRTAPDLALRKYIISYEPAGGSKVKVNNTPVVDVTDLKSGKSTTATYKQAKNPIEVEPGTLITFEIRVYNEGDVDASGAVIVDALPNGLEFVSDNEINKTYAWEKVEDGPNRTVYKTDYLKSATIKGFDKTNGTSLESKYVQIVCKVADDVNVSSVLTNIAEIKDDGISDIDSNPGSNDYINKDQDSSNYTGDKNNKTDLTDSDYFYKGLEDDDDFAKVQIKGKALDLSLQKFITSINKKAPEKSREPEVDVTKLKDGTSTNATYTTAKTPLTVEQGDVIIYTLRVYNEGDMPGYAEEVSDILPEGLGFLVGYKTNVDNYWAISEKPNTVKLSTIPNAINNLSKDDFTDVEKLEDVEVVTGKAKLISTKLKSSNTDTKNLLKAFDKEKGKLDYKDIQIACVVLADKVDGYNFRNIAEIVKETDENRQVVPDRDSTPDSVDPDNYPGKDKDQDDNDYENLTTKDPEIFDLSLQKFITAVNDGKVEGREPKVSINSNGKVQFSQTSSPLNVENNDIITYTIRVYNEGDLAGYAKEVADDLPEGLEYLPDNATNKKYGWKLYDKNGKETSDVNQATTVKTDYLSKQASGDRQDDCLLKAFDGKTIAYRDVQIAFKVVENKVDKQTRIVKNIAEITDDEDENGNPVDDVDSTPGNNKPGEDDIDNEQIYVKYFDLSLKKDLVKIIVTENGTTREITVSNDSLQKVEIHRKKLESTTVKFVYNITVKNEGEIAGYATEVKDYIPEGLEFIEKENTHWTKVSDRVVTTNALANIKLEPGKEAAVQIVLKWINGENNMGLKVNTAEISKDKNDSNTPDIDSTPDNKVATEDDIDNAEVFLGISTGTAPTYFALTAIVLTIMSTGVALIKKYVL